MLYSVVVDISAHQPMRTAQVIVSVYLRFSTVINSDGKVQFPILMQILQSDVVTDTKLVIH